MAMYPPAYTWTESNPHHVMPSHMKMAPNQIMHQQPWPYYYNHPYNPPACCNHGSYYLPPPPNFYPHGFYPPSPFPFSPQPYYYPSPDLLPNYHHNNNNHTSHHCCHQEDDRRPKIKEESQADDDKLTKSDSSYVPVSVSPEPPVEMGQHEHGNHPFPFQIFWLPPKNDEAGNDTNNSNSNSNSLDLVAADKNVCPGTTKKTVQKVIPVKQLVTNEEKKSAKLMANSEKKTDDGSSRVSPKTSKLPPVCLRIDPLPRNKKSSSHSPKSSQQQAQVLKKNKEEKSEGDISNVELEHDNLGDNNMPRVKEVAASEKGQVEEEEKKKKKKKNLSEHEAALIIQSRYRGFEVRKSQPLKKLRQIYEVKNLVSELRNRIQSLESSSSSSSSNIDGKEKVIIGETIMSLLLKLDTIQGLHPYVREVRKSVAKALVGLQEKLDSLAFIESETPSEEIVFISPQQDMHVEDDDAIQGKSDEAKAQSGLCDNHEHNAKIHENENGNDDDAKVYHIPNLEKSTEDVVEDEFKHPQSDSNRVVCENLEMEATESQVGDGNTIIEPQMELHKEKMDDATTECEVEATKLQEGRNTVGEPEIKLHEEKVDECDHSANEGHEVEGGENNGKEAVADMESHEEKFDECDHSRNGGHEVEGGENNGEEVVADMKLEHEVHVDNSSIRKAELDSNNVETMIMYGYDDRKDDVGMVEEKKYAAEEKQVPKGNEIERYEEVIRELARRVKDLEKKLSKKKKIKVNKCNRRTGGHMLYNKTV